MKKGKMMIIHYPIIVIQKQPIIPKKDKSNKAYFKIKELTQQDFPKRKLLFADTKKEIHPFDIDKILTYWKGLIQF